MKLEGKARLSVEVDVARFTTESRRRSDIAQGSADEDALMHAAGSVESKLDLDDEQ